jgi:hypothetical protein
MAFTRTSLARVSGANSGAGSMWMYSTADAIATVVAADYFLEAINEIKLTDLIVVTSSTGGTPAITFTYVNANDGTTIDVVDGLLIPATDT